MVDKGGKKKAEVSCYAVIPRSRSMQPRALRTARLHAAIIARQHWFPASLPFCVSSSISPHSLPRLRTPPAPTPPPPLPSPTTPLPSPLAPRFALLSPCPSLDTFLPPLFICMQAPKSAGMPAPMRGGDRPRERGTRGGADRRPEERRGTPTLTSAPPSHATHWPPNR